MQNLAKVPFLISCAEHLQESTVQIIHGTASPPWYLLKEKKTNTRGVFISITSPFFISLEIFEQCSSHFAPGMYMLWFKFIFDLKFFKPV